MVYLDACQALNHCGIKEQPRKLLNMVAGLQLVEMACADECCGFGGTFSVNAEPISVQMAAQKLQHIVNTGAQIIVSTDYACLLHLQSYIIKNQISLKVMHLADVLVAGTH